MELIFVLATVVLVVVPLLIAATTLLIDRRRLVEARSEFRSRFLNSLPFVAILGGVLAFNAQFRSTAHDISWWLGFEITHLIIRIEGHTVARIQEIFGGEAPIVFFSFMYVYGYVFLLVFPLIAYFVLERLDLFKSLTIAYMVNYGIGMMFYTAFVAFGPRNAIPELVEGTLMHMHYPQLHLLTSSVNEYTNVFPSLHTSLSATVMLFAWHTKSLYRRWYLIALFVGSSVIVATMYLAIHWIVDVVAGVALAGISYWIGIHAVEDQWFKRSRVTQAWSRLVDQYAE